MHSQIDIIKVEIQNVMNVLDWNGNQKKNELKRKSLHPIKALINFDYANSINLIVCPDDLINANQI